MNENLPVDGEEMELNLQISNREGNPSESMEGGEYLQLQHFFLPLSHGQQVDQVTLLLQG